MAKKKEEIKTVEEIETKQVVQEQLDVNALKVEILEYAKNEVYAEIDKEIKKANEKYIKEKNRKIIRKNILIIFLVIGYLITIGFLIHDHYFDKYLTKGEVEALENNTKKEKQEKKEKKEKTEDELKKEEEERKKKEEEAAKKAEEERLKKEEEERQNNLKEKYKDIFNKLNITLGNEYLDSYYKNEYSNKLILSIAVENLNDSDFEVDDGVYMISIDKLIDKVKEFYKGEIELETFKYNGITFKYYKNLNYFILDKPFVKNDIKIERRIIKIEENSHVVIEAKEYYIDNGIVHIPSNNKEICREEDIDKHIDIISSKEYKFENINDNYLLVNE